jgi:hypothetical protein
MQGDIAMPLRVEIGDLDGPIGVVSVRGKRLRYEVADETQRSYLHGIVASCREGREPRTELRYRDMEPEQFLRALERRLHGWTWANIIEDTRIEPPASIDTSAGEVDAE